jgi:hypothetical protein
MQDKQVDRDLNRYMKRHEKYRDDFDEPPARPRRGKNAYADDEGGDFSRRSDRLAISRVAHARDPAKEREIRAAKRYVLCYVSVHCVEWGFYVCCTSRMSHARVSATTGTKVHSCAVTCIHTYLRAHLHHVRNT